MDRSHFSPAVGLILTSSLTLFLSGCATTRHQSFAMSFLPVGAAAPAPQVAEDEPPQLKPALYSRETPRLLDHVIAEHSTEVDSRIRKADQHFETGRQLYQLGDAAAARREFDRAVDLLLTAPEGLADREKVESKLEQLVDNIYRYDLQGLGAGDKQGVVVYDQAPLEGILEMTFPTDPKLRPKVKEELQATVSQLPLEQSDAVLSYIHYFSTDRGHRTLVSGLRRAGKYRPLIQRILDEEGVPQELIYLAQAESGFMPRARSYKAATGMWQFLSWRGNEYGLMQSPSSDDRLDPEKATRAAARHLRDLYQHFGDWYLAMAAYNCGPGCVDHAIQRTGFADFWELRNRSALPQQTMNYVPLILAMTIMAKNPKDYGLENLDVEKPLEYDTVEVHAATSLDLVADCVGRPADDILELNPALLKPVAQPGYQLRVPKGTSASVLAALDNVPAERRDSWRMHRVAQGETLAEIAKRFGTAANSIAAANNRLLDAPEAGDLLIIPASFQPQRATAHKLAVKTSARHPRTKVSARVLHHRASARTYKTAHR